MTPALSQQDRAGLPTSATLVAEYPGEVPPAYVLGGPAVKCYLCSARHQAGARHAVTWDGRGWRCGRLADAPICGRIRALRRESVVTLRGLAQRLGMSGWAFVGRDDLARRIAEHEYRAAQSP